MTSVVNRYYDPTTGSFTNVDPDVATTIRPYGYVADNPPNATDPLGRCGSNSPACGQGNLSAIAAAQAANTKLQSLEGDLTNLECQDQSELNQLNPQNLNILPNSPAGIQDEAQYNALLLADLTQIGNVGLKIAQVANDVYTLYQDAGALNEAAGAYNNAANVLEPLIGTGTAEEAVAAEELGNLSANLTAAAFNWSEDLTGEVAAGGSGVIPLLLCVLIFCR